MKLRNVNGVRDALDFWELIFGGDPLNARAREAISANLFFFVIRITHIAHIKTNHKAQCGLVSRSDSPSETGIRWEACILSAVH